jgi:hypothetical protein
VRRFRTLIAGSFLLLSASAHIRHVGELPLFFEKNRGQAPTEDLFLARGHGYTLALTAQGNRLALRNGRGRSDLRTTLVGAAPATGIRGEEEQAGKVHYFRGTESLTDIPTYARVRYERIYPGIDLIYYGQQRQLEYDFMVAPGADPNSILLHFEGNSDSSIDTDGNLVLQLDQSTVVQHRPLVYQERRGRRKTIQGSYRLLASNTVGFEIGDYDHDANLVIDPILSYSTFLGGADGDDDARAVATDAAGNIYVTGSTTSTTFPTAGPIQANAGSPDPSLGLSDAFVTKLNPSGTALIYSTYLGGSNDDNSNGIAVDGSGNAIIVGSTASTGDFPTTAGAIRRTCTVGPRGSCLNAFVAKLNPGGSALVYSTYLGGTGDDQAQAVAVDPAGNAYITGKTTSTDFPTTAGALSTNVTSGGFVTKLSPAGALVYSTYFSAGGAGSEPRGIAVDSSGSAYITGATASSSTTGTDVFITKLNPAGSNALYTQFIRGARDDAGYAVAVDGSGNAYVAGKTSSIDFTTTAGVIQSVFGGGPAFQSSDGGVNWNIASTGISRSALYALAIAPGSPSTIYAGADDETGGDIFKSSDGGKTWLSIGGSLADARVHALAIDPTTPATIYAGTRTTGVVKTTNAGAAWAATTLTKVFVTALAVDSQTPSTIYAGTDASGFYKSVDSGTSWSAANNGLVTSAIHSIVVDPLTPSTVYVTTGAGIYKSTDGAATWNSINSGLFDPNVNAILISPTNPNVLYAATNSVGVFRSLNGGTFWFAANGGLPSSAAGIAATALTVDPATGTLYAAINQAGVGRVYKSTTGTSWTATALSAGRISAVAVNRGAANTVLAATAGASDAFVAKWSPSGSLVYSTYLGGYADDEAAGIAVDSNGNVAVAGDTSSTNFPISNALQATFAGGSDLVTDAFVAKLNPTGTSITWATYLGGNGDDFARGVTMDASGNVYVVGETGSPDFPTASAITSTRPGFLDGFVAKLSEATSISYSVVRRGGVSLASQGGSSGVTGYVRISPNSGSTTPSGMAIFGFRQNNILVSEASVPATPLITSSGRIYAEISGAVNTGIAIANPSNQPVSLTFHFTDGAGNDFGQGSTSIPSNGEIAGFLNQPPFNSSSNVAGTFTFTASAPVSVIALLGLTNERSEFLITTLPVADLSAAAGTGAIVIPTFADGGGWTTQILLINTTDNPMAGSIQFSASLPQASYTLPARSSFKLKTSGAGGTTTAGYVQIVPGAGSNSPIGVGVFSFSNNGVTVSETGIPSVSTSNAFRLYAEVSGVAGQIGSIQTGVAIANPSSTAVPVMFELTNLSGSSTGLTGSATVPANGQISLFLSKIQGFSSLPNPFKGVLRVSTSSAAGISVTGIRGRYNERGDFLFTTTQATDESRPAANTELFFPYFANGAGYTTQFILFNGSADQSSSGSLRFVAQSGQPVSLTVR